MRLGDRRAPVLDVPPELCCTVSPAVRVDHFVAVGVSVEVGGNHVLDLVHLAGGQCLEDVCHRGVIGEGVGVVFLVAEELLRRNRNQCWDQPELRSVSPSDEHE